MKNNTKSLISCATLAFQRLLILVILTMAGTVMAAPLSGNYTINAASPTAGTNYQSFNDFATSLTTNGVSGNVIATVVTGSGPYNEQVVFQSIAGLGVSASITIDGNGETISAITTTTDRHVIRLSSLQYFTINNLHVNWNPASTGGFYGIHIFNTGNNITISGCNIDISGTTSTLYGSIVASGSETSILTTGDFHNVNIVDNITTGGGYGVSVFGLVSNLASGIVISGNTIYDFHSNGIYLRETDGVNVSNNTLDKRTSNITTANAIQLAQGANVNGEIFNNIISVSQTNNGNSQLRGVYVFGGTGHRIYNNVIHDIRLTSGDFSAIEVRATSSAPEIYFNTIAINDANATTGLLIGIGEELSNTNSVVMNNIISITQTTSGEKTGLFLASNSTISTAFNSNYNILFVPGGNTAMKGSLSPVFYPTLSDWQNASGKDANSIAVDPVFTSATLSLPTNNAANDAGISITGLTTDITGAVRGTPPDAGAYEFSVTGIEQIVDAAIIPYPNPAADNLIINLPFNETHVIVNIYDIYGRLIIHDLYKASDSKLLIDIKAMKAGSYIATINHIAVRFNVDR